MAPTIMATTKAMTYFLLNMALSMMSSGGLIDVAVIRKAMMAPLLIPLRDREYTIGMTAAELRYNGAPIRAAIGIASRLVATGVLYDQVFGQETVDQGPKCTANHNIDRYLLEKANGIPPGTFGLGQKSVFKHQGDLLKRYPFGGRHREIYMLDLIVPPCLPDQPAADVGDHCRLPQKRRRQRGRQRVAPVR